MLVDSGAVGASKGRGAAAQSKLFRRARRWPGRKRRKEKNPPAKNRHTPWRNIHARVPLLPLAAALAAREPNDVDGGGIVTVYGPDLELTDVERESFDIGGAAYMAVAWTPPVAAGAVSLAARRRRRPGGSKPATRP